MVKIIIIIITSLDSIFKSIVERVLWPFKKSLPLILIHLIGCF